MVGNPFIFPWPKILNGRKRLKMVHTFFSIFFCPFFSAFGAPHGAPSFPAPQLTLPPPPLRLEPEKQIQNKSGLRCPIVQVIWFRPLKTPVLWSLWGCSRGSPCICGQASIRKKTPFHWDHFLVLFTHLTTLYVSTSRSYS